MSWYKYSASPFFIDKVQIAAYSGQHLVLLIMNKRYEYAVGGNPWAARIDVLKRKRTPGEKAQASKEVSQIIKNLAPYRINSV